METERLIIRRWTLDDAESLFEYAKDPEVGPVAGWPVHKSIEDSISIIKMFLKGKKSMPLLLKKTTRQLGQLD